MMSKFAFVMVAFLLFGAGFSEGYTPKPATILLIDEAVEIIEGDMVTCPDWILGSFDENTYVRCVDASSTEWSQTELADLAVHGLDEWLISEEWSLDEDIFSTLRLDLPMGEGEVGEVMLISIFPDLLIVYVVLPLG